MFVSLYKFSYFFKMDTWNTASKDRFENTHEIGQMFFLLLEVSFHLMDLFLQTEGNVTLEQIVKYCQAQAALRPAQVSSV